MTIDAFDEQVLVLRSEMLAATPEDAPSILARMHELDAEFRKQLSSAARDAVAALKNLGSMLLFTATAMHSDAVGTAVSWHGGNLGLAQLTELPRLIRFEADDFSDMGAVALGQIDSLRTLFLDRTSVTDAGIRSLARLRSLSWLKISETSVTQDAISELRGVLPNCHIDV